VTKNIPLHSLIIVISEHNTPPDVFEDHELMSTDMVHRDLVGNIYRPELETIVRNEVFRRIALKLSLGERVVINSNNLNGEQLMLLYNLAKNQGAAVFYMLDEVVDGFDPKEVILRTDDIYPVVPLDFGNIDSDLRKTFNGITVVGDVHGNVGALKDAVDWALSRNHFIWFLGDIIDYGPKPIAALEIVYDLIMYGKASMVIGNHERKIARWIQQKEDTGSSYRMRLSEGNKVTVDALNSLSDQKRIVWYGKFRSVISRSSLIATIGNVTLAHAAIHPDYWKKGQHYDIENYALYGEPAKDSVQFKLAHSWIDYVPKDQIVIVGHEAFTDLYPLTVPCKSGGKVVFLDTGCGKGGPLSTADIKFGHEGSLLNLGNFNRHVGL
jgi:hypothetical protein